MIGTRRHRSGAHHEGSITEKKSFWRCLELRRLLQQAGAEVMMTRETDEDVSRHIPGDPASRYQRDMNGRVKLINESGADLFVSLHINYFYDPSIRGAIVFYNNSRPENKLLAEMIQKNINPVVAVNPRPGQYVHQEIKEGDYLLLNYATIPGVIVEMGFITNPDEREPLCRDATIKTGPGAADCIAGTLWQERIVIHELKGYINYSNTLRPPTRRCRLVGAGA